jgi:hypothetical protein
VNQEVKDQWVAALRSGEYKQGKGVLHRKVGGEDQFCCLGVLCDLAVKAGVTTVDASDDYNLIYGPEDDRNTAYPPADVVEWAGLKSANPYVPFEHEEWPDQKTAPLTALNDSGPLAQTFNDIADVIEEHL